MKPKCDACRGARRCEVLCETCHLKPGYELSNGEHRCDVCWNESVRQRQAERKAQLAAMPRCEVPGCKARGRWQAGADGTLLCGRHLKAAQRNRARAAGANGILVYLTQGWTDRESLLKFAGEQ